MRPIHLLNPVIITLTLLFTGQNAFSETVYICPGEGEGGSTLYSETPCQGSNGQVLHFPDKYTTGEGLSDLERQNLSAIETREREEQRQAQEEISSENEDTAGIAGGKSTDSKACDEAKASLKKWQKVIAFGYLPDEEEFYLRELQQRTRRRDEACGITR